MHRYLVGTATALIIGLSTGNLNAQSLRNADEPAEFPPASYTGKQYVDSKGCVFVRAGFDGAVTWVPRVSRSRKVLCGFEPTLSRSEVAAATSAPAPAPTAKPEPVEIVVKPEPAAPAANPRPAPSAPRVVATAPAPRVTKPVVRSQPPRQVTPVVRAQPVQVPTPRIMTPRPAAAARVATACANASATSQMYLRTSSGHVIRCGPQQDHPGAYAASGSGTYAAAEGTILRVAPAPEIKPPPGYRAAFEDDRFNPNRGKQTREGFAQMRLIWTSGVPRRLVDQNTGRDVTSLFPGLKFPFLSFRQQRRYVAVNAAPAQTDYRISTKNTPDPVSAKPDRVTSVPAGHRYVQIGTFSTENKARTAASRLKSMGLPARLGSYQKAGKVYRVVLTGPFGSPSQLAAGLNAARRAGYPNAYTRK